MITVLATIFVFGLIVLVHEWGHFITAKMAGMRVDEFAIGFGPTLYAKRHGETLYSIRAIPLGGYNKIAGMDPDEDAGERGFNRKAVWKRFIVISAGAIMNFVLAIVIFLGLFLTVGIQHTSTEAIVGKVEPGSPAQMAQLEPGDRILTIDGKPVQQWEDIHKTLKGEGAKNIPMEIERSGQKEEVWIIPKKLEGDHVIIGVYPQVTHEAIPVSESIALAFKQTGAIIVGMIVSLKMIVTGAAAGGVAGPVGVAQMAGQVAHIGFVPLLNFTALLSINLGVINLLPVPVLDGGYLVMLFIEGITGKKLPRKALSMIQMTGLALLALIFIYATFNDISRLF